MITKSHQSGFTLIEIMVWILISTMALTAWFYALNLITLSRVKLIEKTQITREAFYLSQKLFEEIKAWWTLDYEEYFNRKVVNMTWAILTSSGHFVIQSGFWNFWPNWVVLSPSYGNGIYYCTSSGSAFWTGGCISSHNAMGWNASIPAGNYTGMPQRYGQYEYQFIDFASDWNGDGNIRGDQDDEHLGEWPVAFTGAENIKELYLISGDGKKRTFFRWNVMQDPDAPLWATCDASTATGSGCLGNIEILKLIWQDMGLSHNGVGMGAYDGVIDTWKIDPAFAWWWDIVAGSNTINYWQGIFSDTVHVKDFKVFGYPNIDMNHAWKNDASDANVNPYVRIDMILTPSWKKRVQMKWEVPEIKISTTLNLVEYFSQ